MTDIIRVGDMYLHPRPTVYGMERLYTCSECRWFRDLSTHDFIRERVIQHPEYGYVTHYEMAIRDILHHDCKAHERAVRLVKRSMMGKVKYAA